MSLLEEGDLLLLADDCYANTGRWPREIQVAPVTLKRLADEYWIVHAFRSRVTEEGLWVSGGVFVPLVKNERMGLEMAAAVP
jgi:hypothetical protein